MKHKFQQLAHCHISEDHPILEHIGKEGMCSHSVPPHFVNVSSLVLQLCKRTT